MKSLIIIIENLTRSSSSRSRSYKTYTYNTCTHTQDDYSDVGSGEDMWLEAAEPFFWCDLHVFGDAQFIR